MTAVTEVPAEARELAAKTAAEIRRRGWGRWSLVDWDRVPLEWMTDGELNDVGRENCGVCLLGGIAAALTGDPQREEGVREHPLVGELVRRIDGSPWRSPLQTVAWWNDQQHRTKTDVLALLDAVAAGQ